MKKIQVIGLPGSGKTTGIKNYIEDKAFALSLLDIHNFTGRKREASFIQAIKAQDQNTIAESACGVDIPCTYIVKLEISKSKLIENLLSRGQNLDLDYTQYLIEQTLPANYTVSSSQDLVDLLTSIFQRY